MSFRPLFDVKSNPGIDNDGSLSSDFTTVPIPRIPVSPFSLDTLPLNPSLLSSCAQYDLQLSKQYDGS